MTVEALVCELEHQVVSQVMSSAWPAVCVGVQFLASALMMANLVRDVVCPQRQTPPHPTPPAAYDALEKALGDLAYFDTRLCASLAARSPSDAGRIEADTRAATMALYERHRGHLRQIGMFRAVGQTNADAERVYFSLLGEMLAIEAERGDA